MQDASMQESMGPISDRSQGKPRVDRQRRDHGPHRLRKAALAVQQGKAPDGLDPVTHAVRSASIVLPENVSFYEAAADALTVREGVTHTSV